MSAALRDADRALMLFSVDPVGLGGISLRASAGATRDAWLDRLRAALPVDVPMRRVPLHIDDDRLLGGMDLAATLQAGRVVARQGLLAECDGGVVVLSMAERLPLATAARIAAVMDLQAAPMARAEVARHAPCRFGVVAFDEGVADDESVPAHLLDRLAFHVALDEGRGLPSLPMIHRTRVSAARAALPAVHAGDDIVEALCSAGWALGIASLRPPLMALKAAMASAALDGRGEVDAADAALAARLVFGPRATQLPSPVEPDADEADTDELEEPGSSEGKHQADADATSRHASEGPDDANARPVSEALDDVVLSAAMASIPARLLASLAGGLRREARHAASGRAGALHVGSLRGRPYGVRREVPRRQARISLIETLRAAAPWQAMRRCERSSMTGRSTEPRVLVRREDFHVVRFRQRSTTTTVFVVDASGSAALHRLAETKGAVELLLAECYTRRDSVAVIAFRGQGAELLLPPTRSLVRAKRSLAALPGGGGTPLAAGIDAATLLADAIARKGATPVVVLLTDGRANIARDGSPGRAGAMADAVAAGSRLRLSGFSTLLMDTSVQPQAAARELAQALGARYVPLPHAAAPALLQALRANAGVTGLFASASNGAATWP